MGDSNLQTKLIKITASETKAASNWKLFSKLQDDAWDRYMLFHTKVDWTETKACGGFKTLPFGGIGCNVEIMFKEEPYEKDGKQYMSRKIMWIKKLEASPIEEDIVGEIKI